MADGHGGTRAGAGRKPRDVLVWRRQMERALAGCVGEADVAAVVATALDGLKSGRKDDQWLIPYVFGKVGQTDTIDQKVEHKQAGPMRVEVVYVDAGPPGPAAPAPGPAADQGRR